LSIADCRLLIVASITRLPHNSGVTLPRFYVPHLDPKVRETSLPPDEATHLTRVLRLNVGDDVAVFDGRGREFRARVTDTSRRKVLIELLEPISAAPEARVPITLVQAVLKGEKMDAVIRDATMMGVGAIEPIITTRTIARGPRAENDRWTRVSVASAKQCRRAVVPTITAPRPFGEWLRSSAHGLRLMLVEPAASTPEICSLHLLENHAAGSLVVIVGPEGGWAAEEREKAEQAGCVLVTLGGLTLRADAVAVAALAITRFALKDL
jgi:16S rRNA (uracil1498-N3)-methyltransferase